MKNEMDMTSGPLLGKLAVFSLPIVFSGLLQLLFNAADIAVVGRFTGQGALAAVSASGPVSSLIVTLFMGLSVGANVLCAQYAGAKREKDLSETLHTAVSLSAVAGLGLMALGMACTGILLRAMGTPAEVLPQARLYLLIYFAGVPATLLYNFGAAVLRAVGDTRRPLYFLAFSGVLNVGLNMFFVAVLGMGVEGVAIATVVSQIAAAVLVVATLVHTKGMCRLEWKKLRIHKEKLQKMLRIGIPAGIQGAAFSVSNLLIQSSVNSLGTAVMAASAVAVNIDSFCFVAIDALSQAAVSFTGQYYDAGDLKRIDKIFVYTMGLGCVLGTLCGGAAYLLGEPIMSIYTSDLEVVQQGIEIMRILCLFQFVNATLNVPFNVLRGMGRSVFPMVSTIVCVCGLRVPWIFLVFNRFPTVDVLYAAWPVTKGAASVTGIVYYLWLRRKLRQGQNESIKGEVCYD